MTECTLDQRLSAADPVGAHSPEILSALSALREEILTMPTTAPVDAPPRSSRRKQVAVGLGVAVILGVGATGAAASGLLARTGLFGSGGEEGSGEIIDLGAPDAQSAVEDLGAGIPFPPGADADSAAANLTDESGLMTEEAVEGTLSWNAACAWATAWLQADASGDTATKARAQATLDETSNWPALVANNPDGGVKAMWQAIAAAAHADNASALRAAGYTVNCTDADVGGH